jgi:hypothetical protein
MAPDGMLVAWDTVQEYYGKQARRFRHCDPLARNDGDRPRRL